MEAIVSQQSILSTRHAVGVFPYDTLLQWSLTEVLVDNKDDIKLHDGVVGAIKEGIDLADNAFSVMNDHGSDQYVQQMAKYIIGDKDFQAGFDHAKCKIRSLLTKVSTFSIPLAGTNSLIFD